MPHTERLERNMVATWAGMLALALFLIAINESASSAETFPPCAHPSQPAFVLLDESTGATIDAESFEYQPDARTLRYRPRECVFQGSFE